MKALSAVVLTVCAAAFFGAASPKVGASEYDKRTTVKINEPVEIPGYTLLPGTYTFRLMDSLSDRNIVQIFSNSDMHLVATVMAESVQRSKPAETSIFTLEQRDANGPKAIHEWFFPGDTIGQEFYYRGTSVASTPVGPALK